MNDKFAGIVISFVQRVDLHPSVINSIVTLDGLEPYLSVLQGRHATTSGCPYSELFMNQDDDETRHVAMEDSYEDFSTDPQEIAYNLGGWLVTLKYMMKTDG